MVRNFISLSLNIYFGVGKYFLLASVGSRYPDFIICSLIKPSTFLSGNSRQMDYLLEIPGMRETGGADSARNSSRGGKGVALPQVLWLWVSS